MSEYTLKCFSESGNAYKVALMLQLTESDWRPELVNLFTGQTRSPEFRSENVMGEVPVMVHHKNDGDLTFSQSGVILTYLAKQTGQFGGKDEMEDYEILRWILFDNHKLSGNTAATRFMAHFMKKPEEPETKFLLARMRGAFKVLNAHLEGRDWVVAERPTIADLSLCGYLYWPEHFGVSWDEFPNMGAWLERIKSLPNWASPEDLMPSGAANAKS